MCDRNGGNIQHLTSCSRGIDVPCDDSFVSHPSDFVIECQTVDVESCEQDGINVVNYEHNSDIGKLSQSSQNQHTVRAQSSETDVDENDIVQHNGEKGFSTSQETTFIANITNKQCWTMDSISTDPSINEHCGVENGENKQTNRSDESDKLVIDYQQCKTEIEVIDNSEDISESQKIETMRNKCSETNGFLSEYISFHDKQAETAQMLQSDKPQKRPRRATKKLSKSFSAEVNTTRPKRGVKKLKKSAKTVKPKASALKNGSKKSSLSVRSTRFRNETGNSTETNEDSPAEEIDNTNNTRNDYIDTKMISGLNSLDNVPCPITYRYIISHITKDDGCILEWCHKVGLIPAEVQCECGSWKEIQMAKDKPLGLIRKCPHCKMRTSVLKGTWFESSHLSIAQIIELTYMWIYRLPQTYVQHELSTSSHHTTGDWYLYCREVCAVILQKTSEKLGGTGKIVEVGETKVGKKKYNMGRLLEGQWILGGIERDSRKMFVVSVKDRDVTTFFSVIEEWIKPGTTIIAEYAKSYHFQNDERLRMFSTTHDINFINASSSPHGQSMNNRWKQRDTDCRKEFPNTYFLEYMYRVKYSNSDDLFLTFVNHLSLVYPGK